MREKKIDDALFEQMYLSGTPRKEMAEFFGVSKSTISDRITAYDVKHGRRFADTYVDKGMIKALFESGEWTPTEISFETKTSLETVYQVLRESMEKGELKIRKAGRCIDERDTNHVWTV